MNATETNVREYLRLYDDCDERCRAIQVKQAELRTQQELLKKAERKVGECVGSNIRTRRIVIGDRLVVVEWIKPYREDAQPTVNVSVESVERLP